MLRLSFIRFGLNYSRALCVMIQLYALRGKARFTKSYMNYMVDAVQ